MLANSLFCVLCIGMTVVLRACLVTENRRLDSLEEFGEEGENEDGEEGLPLRREKGFRYVI
jgi:hypothetical protein